MDLEKFAEAFAKRGLAPSIHIHEGANIHDNQIDKLYLCSDAPEEKHCGRLSLFVIDESQLNIFINDLAVCENTADVCRAVAKLNDGKIPSRLRGKDFVSAIMQYLSFDVTERAVYQALSKF